MREGFRYTRFVYRILKSFPTRKEKIIDLIFRGLKRYSTWREPVNSAAFKANIGLMKSAFSSWSDDYLCSIYYATLRVGFINLEPSPKIRLKYIGKCPAQINHQRIILLTIWRKARTAKINQLEVRRERWLHSNLQSCSRSRESPLVRREQDIATWSADKGPTKVLLPDCQWTNKW